MRYFNRLVLKPCKCSASVHVLWFVHVMQCEVVHQNHLPPSSATLWHRSTFCASTRRIFIQQLQPPAEGISAHIRPATAPRHHGPHFLKGRQRRTRKSTQPAAPRTQQTSNQTPATQPHLPAPSLQVLHQLAPGCTNFCLHGSIVLDAEGCQAEVLYVCVRLELTPADL